LLSNNLPTRRSAQVSSIFLALAFLISPLVAGCGYHVAGHDSNLPESWHEIAIPAFRNDTSQYRIEQIFTESVIREFLERSKYRITQDSASGDAVLRGEVVSIDTTPLLFDATTGEVRTMLVTVHAKVDLIDNKSEKTVYSNKDIVFRQEYQLSTDVQAFFNEQSPALRRMARDFAAQVVSGVLDSF
jgi:outer membrane lipopolysaccharide assembly protein LptE/RlpB